MLFIWLGSTPQIECVRCFPIENIINAHHIISWLKDLVMSLLPGHLLPHNILTILFQVNSKPVPPLSSKKHGFNLSLTKFYDY